jgi:hypothetical protein
LMPRWPSAGHSQPHRRATLVQLPADGGFLFARKRAGTIEKLKFPPRGM